MSHGRSATLGPLLAAAAVAAAVLGWHGAPALSQGRLRADVFLIQKMIPSKMTEKGLIGFARGGNAKILRESAEPELAKRVWAGSMVVAFNQTPNDLEYHVLFYDVTEGSRRFVDDMSIFISDRSRKTFVQKFKLDRPRFRPNRRMELVVTVKRAEVGSRKFDMAGEEVKHDGVVNITDEQARGH